jgi:hypothetical protein
MKRNHYSGRWICIFLFILLIHANSKAQDSSKRFRSVGGITGFGNSFNTNTRYQPIYFAGDFAWSFGKAAKKDFLSWYFEPQFNLVRTPRPLDIELGANLGLRNYIRINKGFYLYQMLGSGPHFITAIVRRQARGFIFSDNLAIGAYTRLNKKSLFLNLQFRMRHLSNANITQPNGGINTYNFLVGFASIN